MSTRALWAATLILLVGVTMAAPARAETNESPKAFVGIGIAVHIVDGFLTVERIAQGPASAAGIRKGDRIIKIDGEFCGTLTLQDSVARMRGPEGTPLSLTVLRGEDRVLEFTAERKTVNYTDFPKS